MALAAPAELEHEHEHEELFCIMSKPVGLAMADKPLVVPLMNCACMSFSFRHLHPRRPYFKTHSFLHQDIEVNYARMNFEVHEFII